MPLLLVLLISVITDHLNFPHPFSQMHSGTKFLSLRLANPDALYCRENGPGPVRGKD